MNVAIVGVGHQRAGAAYALRDDHRVTVFEREPEPGGHVKTVDRRAADGAGRGRHRLHRLQRADVSAVRRAARRARRRDAAERHVVRLGVRRVRDRVQLARRCAASSPTPRTVARPGPVADARRRAAASIAMRGASSTRPSSAARRSASGSTSAATARRSATTSSSRSRRPCGRPPPTGSIDFPVDYLLRFLDNHGLIGVGNAPQWRVVTRRLDGATSSASSPRCRPAPCGPATGRRRSCATPFGVTIADGRRRRERFDAVVMATHADDALRLLATRTPASARSLGAIRVLDRTGRAPHRRAASCRRTRGPGPRGTSRTADCRRPGDAAGHDLPHEPAAVARRARSSTACRSTRATPSGPSGSSRADVQPPDVHVPHARRAGRARAASRAGAGPGSPARISATGSTRTAAGPGFEVAEMIRDADERGGGMRSHLLEGKVRHRRARPFTLRARARRLVRRPRPRRAGRGRPPAAAVRSQPAGRWSRSATAITSPEPADGHRCRRPRRTCAPRARTRRAGAMTLVTNLRVARLRVQPGELLPLPRRRRRPARRDRRGPQHVRGAPPLHAPARGRRRRCAVRGGDGQGLLRLAVHRRSTAATRSTSATSPTACASRSRCARTGRRC